MRKKGIAIILIITFISLLLVSCSKDNDDDLKLPAFIDSLSFQTSPVISGQSEYLLITSKNCDKVQYKIYVKSKVNGSFIELTDGYTKPVAARQTFSFLCPGKYVLNNNSLVVYAKSSETKGENKDDNCSYDDIYELNIKCVKKISKEVLSSSSVYTDISRVINIRNNAVAKKNLNMFLNTIDKENKEYYYEQKHWFKDILDCGTIKSILYEVQSMKYVYENAVVVDINQSYMHYGIKNSITYKELFVKKQNKWKDSDLYFNNLQSKHFAIKYLDGYEAEAANVMNDAEKSYENVKQGFGSSPQDITTIKLYDDRELLRQSVKLSFTWQFTGWYEYPESIKMYKKDMLSSNPVQHELIHKITISESSNNMPYWFCEGLACYYSGGVSGTDNRHRIVNAYRKIVELENEDLEKMSGDEQISNYYNTSTRLIEYIVNKYGEESIKEIIHELGKYPYNDGTASEVNKSNIVKFRKVIKKVIGVDIKNL